MLSVHVFSRLLSLTLILRLRCRLDDVVNKLVATLHHEVRPSSARLSTISLTPDRTSATNYPSEDTLTVLLEAVLVAEERSIDAQSANRQYLLYSVAMAPHFLQLGHSSLEASFSPHPAHLVLVMLSPM